LFSKLRDESVQGCHALGQLLYILDASGSFHVCDGGDLLEVGFDSAMADDEAEYFPLAKFSSRSAMSVSEFRVLTNTSST
jgi:hypothetical protein